MCLQDRYKSYLVKDIIQTTVTRNIETLREANKSHYFDVRMLMKNQIEIGYLI